MLRPAVRFWLGTHEVSWLSRTDVPLFLSARRLRLRKSLPKAKGPWALDSGGFSELSLYGEWRTSAMQYSSEVRHWRSVVGGLEWAAIQDWMCEEAVLKKTGFSVAEHQRRTVHSYILLRQLAPDLPWVPVVQGFTLGEYLDCVARYRAEGVDLSALPLVGLGSICRRQGTAEAERVVRTLAEECGLKIHGFGFKVMGLRRTTDCLASADSLAWSFEARRGEALPGCSHRNCANCLPYALDWLSRVLAGLHKPQQLRFA